MKVVQVLPTIVRGDAVSNDCLAIDRVLREAGYHTEIYSKDIGIGIPKSIVQSVSEIKRLEDKDILLFHYSMGSPLTSMIKEYGGRLVLRYHNVTPPSFFTAYDHELESLCENGLKEIKEIHDLPVMCIADSEFNRQVLVDMGYKCQIEVIPVLIPFDEYDQEPEKRILDLFEDKCTNVLFVGRVAPNKKHEDVIKAFAWYQQHINRASRLFLVGKKDGLYSERLNNFIKSLKVKNVVLTGGVSFQELLAYYRVADLFLCMSEHEGFCVPLLEAMHFQIPVLARNTSAIPYTLGEGGFLLDDNDAVTTAVAIERITTDSELRKRIIHKQNERLKAFSYNAVKNKVISVFKRLEAEE